MCVDGEVMEDGGWLVGTSELQLQLQDSEKVHPVRIDTLSNDTIFSVLVTPLQYCSKEVCGEGGGGWVVASISPSLSLPRRTHVKLLNVFQWRSRSWIEVQADAISKVRESMDTYFIQTKCWFSGHKLWTSLTLWAICLQCLSVCYTASAAAGLHSGRVQCE